MEISKKYLSIAIDGPAGAGKSTIARQIAKKLGYIYIDTGAMYRAMGLYFVRENISLEEEDAVIKACEQVDISIIFEQGEQQVLLNGENVNGLIRSVEAGTMASACSVKKQVREKLVELQQRLAAKENVVMDGRDIGTHVLPNADLKVYLTASTEVRAKRRYEELIRKGESVSLEEIEKSIMDRDYQDMHRDISPLSQAKDAVLVDSSAMTITEVADHILFLFSQIIA
ncbi:(d)CMP kinase [Lachnoclostridium phytofermentans]|uniref:Cytidylate kinase n=1 Tax=Lachnoclostridium phytofermentans (strain ATCC 700394 / DSM 18823 / ISDg) TaxID=357809 RepID=A9KLR7_LACP7|nr:(d)CMP kinase [Lachnoclostridium phytofermentans]ABX42811.1 cytidylate kinase [Lachnoclostridium phytofermentans ISDg]